MNAIRNRARPTKTYSKTTRLVEDLEALGEDLDDAEQD